MIEIHIPQIEYYDNEKEEFIYLEGGTFTFEHSLASISEWESKWRLPFFNTNLNMEHLTDYFKHMCLEEHFTDLHITHDVIDRLTAYINEEPTATTFQNENNSKKKGNNKVLTSEVIYSMMVTAQVPFEADRWNVYRLLALLRVISVNNQPAKKMRTQEVLQQNAKLNAERKKKHNTRG